MENRNEPTIQLNININFKYVKSIEIIRKTSSS